MNINKRYIALGTALIIGSSVSAQNLIDDFEYSDSSELQSNWSSFGGGAQGGAPILSEGTGLENSNSAQYTLTWNAGNNANMVYSFSQSSDLSIYNSLNVSVYLETISGFSSPTNGTTLLLAIKGGDGDSIWQTSSGFEATPNIGSYTQLSFALSENEMETVEGADSFSDVLGEVSEVRLRFLNNTEEGVQQFAYVDNLTAVPEPSSTALLIGLGSMGFAYYFRRRKAKR